MIKNLLWLLLFMPLTLRAQKKDSLILPSADSATLLNEITTQAYEYGRPLKDVPASIGIIAQKDFERFSSTSILPALNAIPGVRMEERSPGSYRLAVRGSSLRSPFGVRNVKVYWNDLPFTDPGGNTYLNLFDFSNVQKAEIIKGPGASLYGAGTGGVLLLKSQNSGYDQTRLDAAIVHGSFGLNRFNASWHSSSSKQNISVQYSHQQSNGYRQQSAMQRDVIIASGNFSIDTKRTISVNVLYGHLNYETPGALTKTEFDLDPSQARPTVGQSKGAVSQKAAITNNTIYSSVSQEYQINPRWSNRTGLYSTFTRFNNPTTRNYERRTELSYGARSVTKFTSTIMKLDFGGEFQQGFSPIKVYDNNQGTSGSLQTDNEIMSTTGMFFVQTDFTLPAGFFLTTGLSYNFYNIDFSQYSNPAAHENRDFKPVLSPRIALLKQVSSSVGIYGSFSHGFSPPTVAELYPSRSIFDKDLSAERGNNYEVGIKGNAVHNVIKFELAAYLFKLNNAIASRRDTTIQGDPEYFVNAGTTNQKGLEATVAWQPRLVEAANVINNIRLWTSYTYAHYRFGNYLKDVDDLSGNRLTGTTPHIIVAGFDFSTRKGLYANITFTYTDRIPLDDANKSFATGYSLLACRMGYKIKLWRLPMEFFGGGDNLLDVKYSLGNDLNAVGGRYYNAASPRNYFVGFKTSLVSQHNN